MKAWILSDLHLEFGRAFDVSVPTDADVAIFAGDILTKGIVPTLGWLASKVPRHVPVILVAGNHEYYRAAMLPSIQEAREVAAQIPHIHFLENDVVELGGIAFIGGTLWTDFKLGGRDPERAMFEAEHGTAGHRMTDYKRIKYSKLPYRRFKPMHAFRKHAETREFIASELHARKGQTTVVVTHHAPSVRSLDTAQRADPLSPCYASDLEDLILETDPTMWVHGHVHRRVDYHVGLTKVISNPRGYPGERSGFDSSLTIEI
jgi:Icc-related predicted phosphoesterase